MLRTIVLALIASLVASCGGDGTPTDAATDSVDDSAPLDSAPADTGAPDAAPPDAGPPPSPCGFPELLEDNGLRRWPHLQSMTPNSTIIAWSSTTGGDAVLRYRVSPDGPWSEVAANSEVFDVARTGDDEDYVAYDAALTGLGEDTDHCYEIVEDGVVLARGLTFHTAWTRSDKALRILSFGDSGDGGLAQGFLRMEMLRHDYDVLVHLGDMAYSNGTYEEFEENYFGMYQELMHRLPQYTTIGNHEYNTDLGDPYIETLHLFEMALRPEHQERYYSFDYGDIHFVSLDSNGEMLATVSDGASDDMLDWLEMDLAGTDKTWIIAFFHHPPYSSSERASGAATNTQRDLVVPILEAGGVDLVLVGHEHHYERTVPIRDDAPAVDDSTAITYVVAGAGGAGLRPVLGEWFTAATNDNRHNFLRLTVEGCTATGEIISVEGVELDRFVVDGCD